MIPVSQGRQHVPSVRGLGSSVASAAVSLENAAAFSRTYARRLEPDSQETEPSWEGGEELHVCTYI